MGRFVFVASPRSWGERLPGCGSHTSSLPCGQVLEEGHRIHLLLSLPPPPAPAGYMAPLWGSGLDKWPDTGQSQVSISLTSDWSRDVNCTHAKPITIPPWDLFFFLIFNLLMQRLCPLVLLSRDDVRFWPSLFDPSPCPWCPPPPPLPSVKRVPAHCTRKLGQQPKWILWEGARGEQC